MFKSAVLLLVFISPAIAAGQKAEPPKRQAQPTMDETPAQIRATLLQLEKDWAQAIAHRDAAKLDTIVAREWIQVNPKGKVTTKKGLLDALRAASSPAEGTPELSDVQVLIFGSTAQVWGRVKEKSDVAGQERSGEYVFGDLFVRRGGGWQAVYSHTTQVHPGE